jgi:hypothetical protein
MCLSYAVNLLGKDGDPHWVPLASKSVELSARERNSGVTVREYNFEDLRDKCGGEALHRKVVNRTFTIKDLCKKSGMDLAMLPPRPPLPDMPESMPESLSTCMTPNQNSEIARFIKMLEGPTEAPVKTPVRTPVRPAPSPTPRPSRPWRPPQRDPGVKTKPKASGSEEFCPMCGEEPCAC